MECVAPFCQWRTGGLYAMGVLFFQLQPRVADTPVRELMFSCSTITYGHYELLG